MPIVSPPITRTQRALMLAALFLLSCAMLAFQVLQVVVLSLQLFPEAAFLVVSLSMLGLGCGGSIAAVLVRSRIGIDPLRWLWGCGVGFSIAVLAAMVATSRMHGLLGLILVNTPPFVAMGVFLALTFAAWTERANQTYFFDLVGAGIGCALVVWLLNRLADAGLVAIALAALGAIATVLLGAAISARRALAAALVLAAVLALVPRAGAIFTFGPEPEKFYGQLLTRGPAGGTLGRQKWNYLGRLDAVIPGPAIDEFEFARGTKELLDAGCEFRLLFSNGYNWTFTIDFKGNDTEREGFFRRAVQNTPYLFTRNPEVLNLGSGGGVDMYLAIANGARSATGVEINPLMIEACTRWYPDDWDGLWRKAGVTVRELDARTYVNTTDQTFDVITLNAVDTGGSQASLLSVNFLYTTEAFQQYLRLLRPGGVIFLTRPREQLLRVVTAAIAALRANDTTAIERHLAVLGEGELLSAAVYADPLTNEQIETMRRRVDDGYVGGRLQYLADTDTGTNTFTEYFAALRAGDETGYFRRATLRVEPTTDDQPYFYQLERDFTHSRAGRLLLVILLWVTSVAMLLIFAPLLRLTLRRKDRLVVGSIVYFFCLGLGFMLVEICLMHELSLFLGHPAYSVTVTLGGMLICCGLGSLTAGRFAGGRRDVIPLALVMAALAIVGYAFLASSLAYCRFESLPARILVTLAFLAPGSFFLGMPFPLKLRTLEGTDDALVAWAWAVNGLASVAGSVLAVALTMNLGFRAVLLVAAAVYLVALVSHVLTPRLHE
jgi:spermidine synthase